MKENKFNLRDKLLTNSEAEVISRNNNENIEAIKLLDNNISNDWLVNQLSYFLKNKLKTFNQVSQKLALLNTIIDCESDKFTYNKISTESTPPNFNLSENDFISKNLWKYLNWELFNSNSVFIISPFISQEMLNKIQPYFEFNENLVLKIITTTYDGKSKMLALNGLRNLAEMYPNRIEVKIENLFNISRSRIHAKAYYFEREDNWSSLYIGSSNFTTTGVIDGKEYSIKLSEFREKNKINDFLNDFNEMWNNNDYIDINDNHNIEKLIELQSKFDNLDLNFKKSKNKIIESQPFKKEFVPYEFQLEIINDVKERIKNSLKKHLLVMATGTGKTATIAFIYKYLQELYNKDRPKMLYIAPSIEILDQTVCTFKNILGLEEFGIEFYSGREKQIDFLKEDVIFTNTESLHKHLSKITEINFDLVVFDEAHHLGAKTFEDIFFAIHDRTKQIFGLTATPERTDGISVVKYFNNSTACDLDLFTAIDKNILSDFDYYYIKDDSTDLKGVNLNESGKLLKLLSNKERNSFVYSKFISKIGAKKIDNKCLVFCFSKEHAESFSNYLNVKGEKSRYLFSGYDSSGTKIDRYKILNDFKSGAINYLCVVDMLNEGVDIPEVDKVVFLRPTNSLILYLQQLGRGLRKVTDKRLEVFDFVNNVDLDVNKLFNPIIGISELSKGIKISEISKNIDNINDFLPGESMFILDKKTISEIKASVEKFIKLNLYSSVLNEYRQDKDFQSFESFFVDQKVDIVDFYEGNSEKNISKRVFYGPYSQKNLEKALKNFVNFRNIYLIDKFIEIIETKRSSGSRLIDELFVSTISYTNYSSTPNGKKFIDFFDYYLSFDDFLLEIKFILKYIKRNKNCFTKVIESIYNLVGEHFTLSNIHSIIGIRFNKKDDTIEGLQNAGLKFNEDEKIIGIVTSGPNNTDLQNKYNNYFDGEKLYWEAWSKWDYKIGNSDKFIDFKNGKYKTALFYRDNYSHNQSYKFLGFAKFPAYKCYNAGERENNGKTYNQTAFIFEIE